MGNRPKNNRICMIHKTNWRIPPRAQKIVTSQCTIRQKEADVPLDRRKLTKLTTRRPKMNKKRQNGY